ncbi:hypothetical protein G7Y89_g7102 [Cudoniella acicularis]|uniref:Serine hydrolase domain-containing protein n=1 Tax=Cudoniella acicularis TaxID=354080 RepID=A0A8H4W2E3_9HELO|nr:hypothetical protein G7Y89_g7102 [Cudoniella acicularis]
MHFLCLHGRGTNNKIFEAQTSDIHAELQKYASGDSEYFEYFQPTSTQSLIHVVDQLESYIADEGPFDGVVAFSQGATVVATLIARYSEGDNGLKRSELPFKCALFFSALQGLHYEPLLRGEVKLLESTPDSEVIQIPTAHIWGQNDLAWSKGSEELSRSLGRIVTHYDAFYDNQETTRSGIQATFAGEEASGLDEAFAVEQKVETENITEIMSEPVYMSGWKLHVLTFALCLGLFIVQMESSIVSTSIISITNELQGFEKSSWLPQRFQTVNGDSNMAAGIRLIAFGLLAPAGSVLSAAIIGKTKIPPIYHILLGSILEVIGTTGLSRIPVTFAIAPSQYGWQVVTGLGVGFCNAPLMLLVNNATTKRDQAVGTAAITQFRVLGGILGLAIVISVMNRVIRSELLQVLPVETVDQLLQTTEIIQQLSESSQATVRAIFGKGYNGQMKILIGFAAAQLPSTALMWTKKPDDGRKEVTSEATIRPPNPLSRDLAYQRRLTYKGEASAIERDKGDKSRHTEIEGNEEADSLAKRGTKSSSISIKTSFVLFRLLIRQIGTLE